MEEKKQGSLHRLLWNDRTAGTVTGVKDVRSFDESQILLVTEDGKLLIKGDKLHVRQLDLEKGEVELEGRADSLTYLSKNTDKKEESLWKRMLR
ncbi:MAG: sporulation protein YabP [Blautia sp.]|nr:sporulation protein YabP [Blautia sp.]